MFAERPLPPHSFHTVDVNISNRSHFELTQPTVSLTPYLDPFYQLFSPSPAPPSPEELAGTPDYSDIFRKYYLPSLSPRTQPPSPDLIVASEPADPFSEPNTLSLDDTYQLLKEPQVIIPVPFGIFTRSQVLGILDEAVKMVLEAKATQLSRKEEDLIGEGFDKGVASAAMIFKSHGVPQFVIDTLTWASRSKDRPDPSEFELWPIPPFSEIDRYLVKMKGSLKKLLGTYQDEDLHVYANGQVEMNISDEGGFFGQCEIRLDDTTLAGYVLGHIFLKGTAVVLSEVNRLFLYTPDASLDPEWSQMDGSMGAALERDSDGNLVLFRMPELEVVSLSDW